jgi:hypothetical protein
MGDGPYGTTPGAAVMNNIVFINGPWASANYLQTDPAYYSRGNTSGASFNYGGPSAC